MRRAWKNGLKVVKCIGFDAGEDHRLKGGGDTYAVGNFNICPDPELPPFRDRYDVDYPLRTRMMSYADCTATIAAEPDVPMPGKTACFFCSAMREIEIRRLAVVDPDYHTLALEMENLYRGGHHYRGDDYWTVKATHKDTGEVIAYDCVVETAADARHEFRTAYDDTKRPHKYKLRAYPAVPGLGRSYAWKDVEVD